VRATVAEVRAKAEPADAGDSGGNGAKGGERKSA
jgi:hypothetical protein